MCVGVPMQITEINYPSGVAEAKGVKREIGLQLMPENTLHRKKFPAPYLPRCVKW